MAVHEADIVIIGGGIAGLSLAARLGDAGRVILLEAEPTLNYHTSSRSGAQMQPTYGPSEIRAITAATLELIPGIEDEIGHPILTPRPLIWCEFDGTDGIANLHQTIPGITDGTISEAAARLPALRKEKLTAVAFDEGAKEVNVSALLEHYTRQTVANGVEVIRGLRVDAAERASTGWTLRAGEAVINARVVVNASGAWADVTAATFGKVTKGLQPYRRTITIAKTEGMTVVPGWPMSVDVNGSFYFRVEGEYILASPMEDLASPPEDAKPLLSDIELVKNRINDATHLALGESVRSWTGLRTMASDGIPVVGWEPGDSTFFWLTGQGGYGIQTSAAMGRLAAAALLGTSAGLGDDADRAFANLTPARFDSAAVAS